MLETKLISLLSFLFFVPKEKSSKEIALVISGRDEKRNWAVSVTNILSFIVGLKIKDSYHIQTINELSL